MNWSDLLQSHPTNQQQIYKQYKYLQLSDKKVYIKDKSRPDVYKMQQHCHCKHKDVSSLSIWVPRDFKHEEESTSKEP